jgi:carbonic anhydrase
LKRSHLFIIVAVGCFAAQGYCGIVKKGKPVSFGYTGRVAPEFWGGLKSDYGLCDSGRSQSPIDVVTADVVVDASLPNVQTNYRDVNAVLINNGHTLEVEYHNGSKVTFGGEEYELLQFHFHSLSEHLVNGQAADMEVHLVHRHANGQLLVVGAFINVGAENALLAKFWNQFPTNKGKVDTKISINAANLLPSDLSYYTYQGSLTTPPCSEIVTWVVLKTPIEMSQSQLDVFANVVGNNARTVQDLNGRDVRSAN